MIEGHLDFDKKTAERYHNYFDYAIRNKEVEILILEKNIKIFLSPNISLL